VLGILSLIGVCTFLSQLFYRKQNKTTFNFFITEEILLIICPLFAILSLHTFLYWCKSFPYTNLGLLRYMVTIIPSSAMLGLRGLNIILLPIKNRPYVSFFIVLFIGIFAALTPFFQDYFPFVLMQEEKTVKACGQWMREQKLTDEKLYYSQQFLIPNINKDPFDRNKALELTYALKENFTGNLEDSSVIVWDAHYSANEGRVPLDSLLGNPHFELLHEFVPAQSFSTLGGYDFKVYVFQ
jgi:hypothetical protein